MCITKKRSYHVTRNEKRCFMYMYKKVKIIVTLGPATKTERDLRKLKEKEVDFVRVNMSHSTLEDLRYFIRLAKKVGISFVLDTEGSQVRSGIVSDDRAYIKKGANIKIHAADVIGNARHLSLRPREIISRLEMGDFLHIDFESLVVQVMDTSFAQRGHITARAIKDGGVGSNKGVAIDSLRSRESDLPVLSQKDLHAIAIGLEQKVEYIAASFMRSGAYVDAVRNATKRSMKIISKIECVDALKNLDDIIEKSDFLLIDRGDLSKEIPLEKIPIAQKIILKKASKKKKNVFVATNLLETMVEKSMPTRAEAHDVIATVLDGAWGVTLSAETAIGKYPIESVVMMRKLLKQAEYIIGRSEYKKPDNSALIQYLERSKYLFKRNQP